GVMISRLVKAASAERTRSTRPVKAGSLRVETLRVMIASPVAANVISVIKAGDPSLTLWRHIAECRARKGAVFVAYEVCTRGWLVGTRCVISSRISRIHNELRKHVHPYGPTQKPRRLRG